MNVRAQNVEADKSEQPKNQQNKKDSPKHKNLSFEFVNNASFHRSKSRLPEFAREDVDLLLAGFLEDGAQVPTALFQLLLR